MGSLQYVSWVLLLLAAAFAFFGLGKWGRTRRKWNCGVYKNKHRLGLVGMCVGVFRHRFGW